MVLTSREAPVELGPLEGEHAAVRSFELAGLGIDAGRVLLHDKALQGDEAAWARLVDCYGGNGLALKIAGRAFAGSSAVTSLRS